MKLKRLESFSVNEGILSSVFKGISDVFKTKKSKIDSMLKQIKKAKSEEIDNRIAIEKEIWSIPKENTPEYRFLVSNLERQNRVYANLKMQEIDSLLKETESQIEKNPKLQAYFSSELAKIEADSTEKLLKGLNKYKTSGDLNLITAQFDSLVKDANRKSAYFEDMMGKGDSSVSLEKELPEEIASFLNYSNTETQNLIDDYDEKQLKSLLDKLRDFKFDIEIRNKMQIEEIRKELKQAKKFADSQTIDSLENEESKIRNHYRNILDIVRSKISVVDKKIKSLKYENY